MRFVQATQTPSAFYLNQLLKKKFRYEYLNEMINVAHSFSNSQLYLQYHLKALGINETLVSYPSSATTKQQILKEVSY